MLAFPRFPVTAKVLLSAALAAGALVGAAPTPATAATAPLGLRAVTEASRHHGQVYRYGAAGPTRFDCSGFTSYVFARLGRSLPHSSSAQYAGVRHISRSQLAVGDLVFTIRSGGIRHVGIYAGAGLMWAATQTGDVVRKQSLAGRTLVYGRVG